jgi:hypothetical protein
LEFEVVLGVFGKPSANKSDLIEIISQFSKLRCERD